MAPRSADRPIIMRVRLPLLLLCLLALAAWNTPPVSAHPADRLLVQVQFTLYGDHIEATYALTGGLLATGALADRIDQNGDGVFAPDEAQAWLRQYLAQIS